MSDRSKYLKNYRCENKDKIKRVNLTLTVEEHKRLCRMAKAESKKPTGFLKELAFVSLEDRANYPLDVSSDLGELVLILRGIGNNINQIARHSNTFKKVLDENEVLLNIKNMEDEIKKFLKNKNSL